MLPEHLVDLHGRRVVHGWPPQLGLGFVAAEAHSVAVDQRTHLVYFPLERGSEGRPELLIMAPS